MNSTTRKELLETTILRIQEDYLQSIMEQWYQSLRQFGIRKCPKKLVISLLFCNFIVVNQ